MLKVEDRVVQLRLNHVFIIYDGDAPAYFNDHCVLINNNSSTTSKNLILPKLKVTNIHCFFYKASKNLNVLPSEVKDINFKQKLKKALKSFMSTNTSDTI